MEKMSSTGHNRIDKFLWSVRLYKTRSQAADACKNGRVQLNSTAVKPSRVIEAEDIITVRKMPVIYTYRCLAVPPSRVGARLVNLYLEDLTPEEELQKLDLRVNYNIGYRKRGSGRPTKRERRDIDRLRTDS